MGDLVWGRSPTELREVAQIFSINDHSNDYEWNEPSVGIEYNRKVHGPLKYSKITFTANDRALAEAHMEKSKSGRIIKRKFESLDDNWDWDTETVKKEPASTTTTRSKPKSKAEKPQPESEPELSDCGEVFPSVGPYQCEICQNITNRKLDFVNHIKAKHRNMIDPGVLRTLESDLRKRNKKMMKKTGKLPKQTTKKKARRKIEDGESDEEFSTVTRKYHLSGKHIHYIDEEGNSLPKAAGKLPASCNICGRTISRGNEMLKHQQSLTCRSKAIEKGDDNQWSKSTVVVVVKNYVDMKNSNNSNSNNSPSPSFKSQMTKRYEAEQDKDPGDYDEDYDEGHEEEVDDAIKAAVAASLETAREDLRHPDPEPEKEPEQEPDEVDQNKDFFKELQSKDEETFQPTSNLLWSNMWQ